MSVINKNTLNVNSPDAAVQVPACSFLDVGGAMHTHVSCIPAAVAQGMGLWVGIWGGG